MPWMMTCLAAWAAMRPNCLVSTARFSTVPALARRLMRLALSTGSPWRDRRLPHHVHLDEHADLFLFLVHLHKDVSAASG
jgi:hypothetical protein